MDIDKFRHAFWWFQFISFLIFVHFFTFIGGVIAEIFFFYITYGITFLFLALYEYFYNYFCSSTNS